VLKYYQSREAKASQFQDVIKSERDDSLKARQEVRKAKAESVGLKQVASQQQHESRRQEAYGKGTEVVEIMQQRERIREQIKVVKRQFEADRTTMMNKIRLTNSRD